MVNGGWTSNLPVLEIYDAAFSIGKSCIASTISIGNPTTSYQLMWGRFINTHRGNGNNSPCDLHNEHVNKLFKKNMGANTSEAAITTAARSVTTLQEISTKFDKETGLPVTRSAHSTLDDIKDVNSVVSIIIKKKIFDTQKGRMHSLFKNFSSNPLHNLDQEKYYVGLLPSKNR